MKKTLLAMLSVAALAALPGCSKKKDAPVKPQTSMKKEECCKKNMACKKDKCSHCKKCHKGKKCDDAKKMSYRSYLELEPADEFLV